MKRKLAVAVLVVSAFTFGVSEVYSKSYGSRSYGSKSSFSFKTSPRPKATKVVYKYSSKKKTSKKKTSGSMSKFNKSKKVSATVKNRINNQTSKRAYTKYKSKFKTQPKAIKPKAFTSASDKSILTRARGYDKNTYHTRRSNYYSNRSYDPYVYNYSSSYGMYDSRAMWGMRDPGFFYNYGSSPGVTLFLADMLIESRHNAEVKRQLDEINRSMAQMKANGVAVNSNYKPKGVDLDVMLIPSVAESNKAELTLCTGASDGTYASVGRAVKRSTKNIKVTTIGSTGSIDNLNKMEKGACNAAFVQRDSYNKYLSKVDSKLKLLKVSRMYNEYAQLVCTKDSGITDIDDLDSKDVVITGPKGSGSSITWNNIKSDAKQKTVTSMTEGVALLLEGDAQCAFNVTSLKSNFMNKTENRYGEFLRLADVDVKDYTKAVIDDDNYDSLTEGMFWISWDIDTVTIPMDLVINEKWARANKTAYASFMNELLDVVPEIRKATNSK